MAYIICIVMGYLMGCISPSYILSKRQKIDLRTRGTNNLGATNTFMTMGKAAGAFVLIYDILKAFLAVKIAVILYPGFILAGAVAGSAAITGHIFPFYLKFKGGKGVASLGGLVLGLDWKMFLFLLLLGVILAIIFNWGCAISFSASLLFPLLYSVKIHSPGAFCILMAGSICIIYKHIENVRRIRDGRELPVRDFLKQHLLARKCSL